VTLPRTGTIQVNNETYTVTQTGIDNTYSFSPVAATLPAAASTTNVTVNSAVVGSGVSISVTSGSAWLSAIMPYGGSTGQPIYLSATANISNDLVTLPRTGTVQVNNE